MVLPDASSMVAQFEQLKAMDPSCYKEILDQPRASFAGAPPSVINDLCVISATGWRLLPHAHRWVSRYFRI